MSIFQRNPQERRTALSEPVADMAVGPSGGSRCGDWSVALGVINLVSGAFLAVMFASLATGGSASPWGPINALLSAFGNVILACLVPHLSRRAARSARARGFVRAIMVASLAAAASGFLLVAGVLPFEPSTVVSMVAIVAQCVWMIWLNRHWLRDPALPRMIPLAGLGFGGVLLGAFALAGASFLLPSGSLPANLLLYPGVVLGGLAWLLWPTWYILLGQHLRRADPRP